MTSEGSQGHNCGALETKIQKTLANTIVGCWGGVGNVEFLVCSWYWFLDKPFLSGIINYLVVHIEFLGINKKQKSNISFCVSHHKDAKMSCLWMFHKTVINIFSY